MSYKEPEIQDHYLAIEDSLDEAVNKKIMNKLRKVYWNLVLASCLIDIQIYKKIRLIRLFYFIFDNLILTHKNIINLNPVKLIS